MDKIHRENLPSSPTQVISWVVSLSLGWRKKNTPTRLILLLPGNELCNSFRRHIGVPALKVLRSFSGGGKGLE